MEMVLNELSVSNEEKNPAEANQIISSFLKTYSDAVKSELGIAREIKTAVNINDLEISKNYYISQWRNSSLPDKDERLRLLGICQRQKLIVPENEDVQYVEHKNIVGKGLQISYESQLPLISFPSEDKWKQHIIDCSLVDIELDTKQNISLKNIFCNESLDEHKEWIINESKRQRPEVKTPEEFLEKLDDFFPSLVFHKNAISQIKTKVSPVDIPVIVNKLLTLEEYFCSWDGKVFDRSAFPRRFVSPESEATLKRYKKQHTYEWEGVNYLASYHVRYTGENVPGRIFIYPHNRLKKCIVFSLHTKLPTVDYPK